MPPILGSTVPQCLYIHIPFCLKKCDYCDFYSISGSSPEMLERYSAALLSEIDRQAASFPAHHIRSIYFGGGTPSLLSVSQITAILERILLRFSVDSRAEISLEANPATIDQNKLAGMVKAGVNRLSLGVQSFDDGELRMLGRVHSSRQARETLRLIADLPLKNYNVDLIYGLPGQSINGWLNNLRQAVAFGPQHISMYLLQLEPDTPMGQAVEDNRLLLLGEDSEAEMYYAGIDYLSAQGYRQYEISNLSRPGAECRHNMFYWQAESYLGLGAGAVSFAQGRRWRNQPDMQAYLAAHQSKQDGLTEELERMDQPGLIADAVILGLRMTEGIDLAAFAGRFGLDLADRYDETIRRCQAEGLLEMKHGRLFLTRAGYFLSNQVMRRFLD